MFFKQYSVKSGVYVGESEYARCMHLNLMGEKFSTGKMRFFSKMEDF